MKRALNRNGILRVLACQTSRLASAALALAVGTSTAAANQPTADQALKLAPVQKQVEFDRPTAAEIEKCTIKEERTGKSSGWVVYGPQSQVLRRFIDSNGDGSLDLWCYYKDGLEVYRDVDTDFNRKADQYRWLNTGGTRIGLDRNEDGAIDSWQAISAEEVTQEIVAALASADVDRFTRLLLTESELETLGLGDEKKAEVAKHVTAAQAQFKTLAQKQRAITDNTHWVNFGGSRPGTVPSGNDGSTKDVVVYENVITMVETAGKHEQLPVGTIVQVGGVWRLIDAPRLLGDKTAEVAANGLFFRVATANIPNGADGISPTLAEDLRKMLAEVESIEKSLIDQTDPQQIAKLHTRRGDLLLQLAAKGKDGAERGQWIRQLADGLSVAVQTGAYPDGIKQLKELSEKVLAQPELKDSASYIVYRTILADYAGSLQAQDADYAKIQSGWIDNLKKFVADYPEASDAPDAMLQLGNAEEWAGRETDAKTWYGKIAKDFPNTAAAKKASGAVTRLSSIGKPMVLRGKTLDGRQLDMAAFAGRTVLIHYWSADSDVAKGDLKTLKELYAKYSRQGFSIIGVSCDHNAQTLAGVVRQQQIPWAQLHEPGALDSRLATEMGIMTLPTMILVDKTGKVINRNVLAADLDKLLGSILTANAAQAPGAKKMR